MKAFLIIIASCLVLTACGNRLISKQDDSSKSERCKRTAQKYIQSHVVDKVWRAHEYNQQYKICMNAA